MAHWLDKVVELLSAPTSDLGELAGIAGYDPRTFYSCVDPGTLDLSSQDTNKFQFSGNIGWYVGRISKARHNEERLALILDSIISNRESALQLFDALPRENSIHALRTINRLREFLYNNLDYDTSISNIDDLALVNIVYSSLAQRSGYGRVRLFYYMAKHLSKYPEIRGFLSAIWNYRMTKHADSYNEYRQELDLLLENKAQPRLKLTPTRGL